MARLTLKTEYALLALIHLARQDRSARVSVETLAREREIPAPFLEQIMMALKKAGYVTSSRGKYGGFALARAPQRISMAEIVRLFDGALAPTLCVSEYFYSETPIHSERKAVGVFREIRDYVAKKLEATTLADLL